MISSHLSYEFYNISSRFGAVSSLIKIIVCSFCFFRTLANSLILRTVDLQPLFDKEILNKSELVKYPNALGLLSDKQYFFSFPGSTSDVLSIIAERVGQALDKNG